MLLLVKLVLVLVFPRGHPPPSGSSATTRADIDRALQRRRHAPALRMRLRLLPLTLGSCCTSAACRLIFVAPVRTPATASVAAAWRAVTGAGAIAPSARQAWRRGWGLLHCLPLTLGR